MDPASKRDSCTGLPASAPGLPKGSLSASLIAFTMDHLTSMLEGQSINGLVAEYIVAIDATSIPGCCNVLDVYSYSSSACLTEANITPRDD
jgi:hypothetical protein